METQSPPLNKKQAAKFLSLIIFTVLRIILENVISAYLNGHGL